KERPICRSWYSTIKAAVPPVRSPANINVRQQRRQITPGRSMPANAIDPDNRTVTKLIPNKVLIIIMCNQKRSKKAKEALGKASCQLKVFLHLYLDINILSETNNACQINDEIKFICYSFKPY
ncbi:MAG: hypothetical protein WC231_08100, partial [Dehalococcoidales bacterium]